MKRLVLTLVLGLSAMVWAVGGDMGNGDGSEGNPYLIEDLADFDAFANPATAATYWAAGVHTQLMTDIDLAGRTYTTAVIAPHDGSTDTFAGTKFAGQFDGNGYSVKNLAIELGNPLDYMYFKGLFGYIENATILNLTIENITIDGFSFIGGLAGYSLSSSIVNCSCSGQINGYDDSGGLIGFLSNGSVTGCHSNAIVTGEYRAGGLIGQFSGGTITNCYATGDVSVKINDAGGLIGDSSSPSGYVDSCYATGNITSADYSAGGFIGRNYGGQITNSYATGNVTSVNRSGGFTATNTGIIINCYSTGDVCGGEWTGVFAGYNSSSIVGCFANISSQAHGISDAIGHEETNSSASISVTTADQLQLQNTFTDAGWDFSTPVWMLLREGEDYPRLAWQTVFEGDIAGLYGVDIVDFAYLARYWGLTDCGGAEDCGRADIDGSGDVGLGDLAAVAEDWLRGL